MPEVRLIDTIWNSVMEGGDWDTKNQQQAHLNALKHIKAWHKLLAAFATSAKIELALLNSIQVYCYTDAKMLKLFPQIIKMMYDVDVIDEDTIMFWHRKGSSPKGRQQFLADMAPFIRWLREALLTRVVSLVLPRVKAVTENDRQTRQQVVPGLQLRHVLFFVG